MKERLLHFNLYLGLFVLILAFILRGWGFPFFRNWFYIFTWWPLILILDSLNYRRGKTSPLSQSGKDFLFTAFISVFVWLIFELFNLRLQNWKYFDLPLELPQRWLGYFLAFSSVLPALKELSVFFTSLLRGKGPAFFRIRNGAALSPVMMWGGGIALLLPLIWPKLFFPFVWVGFIFLIEPLNLRLGNQSLIKDFEREDWGTFWSWILAGAVAGIFWEFLNFWAGSHWEYALPFLDFAKLFQMPICGYTGFLPFALEVFALDQLLTSIRKKYDVDMRIRGLIFLGLLVFYAGVFYLIDIFTVSSLQL